MKKFQQKPVCQKCGCNEVATKFHSGTNECLVRECQTCGFQWDEETRDKGNG